MRFKIRKAFYTVAGVHVAIVLVYLYGFAWKDSIVADHGRKAGVQKIPVPSASGVQNNVHTTTPTMQFVNRTSHECPGLLKPVNVRDRQLWQQVNEGREMFVFSAFIDEIGTRQVRLIGVATSISPRELHCHLWYDDISNELNVVVGSTQRIPEDHGRRYSAIYIKCPLPDQRQPYAISIMDTRCGKPKNILSVIHSDKPSKLFTVCVTPFNFRYSRAYELVEMIEFNRLLGAEYFTFYNHSIGTNVDKVLRQYTADGLVETVQWNLPMNVDHWPPAGTPDVHYFAQMASLNDCLYRNLHRSKYLVYTDLDEFIVPRTQDNWTKFVEDRLQGGSKIGAFVFRCNFFRKEWSNVKKDFKDSFKGMEIAQKFKSIVLLNVLREVRSFEFFQRSKYIIRPEAVDTVGIHNIWTVRSGYEIVKIPQSDGLLHHYRNWENPDDKLSREKDLTVHRFKDKILQMLEKRWSLLPNIPLDIPLSNYTSPV